MSDRRPSKILALSGGVGGAKLACGLYAVLPPGGLGVLVNTGDDFSHLGLSISPDLDTVMYTLAGVVNPETGWGRAGESWTFMDATAALGGDAWFRLGDKDLAVHVERTRRLRAGEPLGAVTAELCHRFGIAAEVMPMSDDAIATLVDSDAGTLAFQDYFVRRGCEPRVRGFRFQGIEAARPNPRALAWLEDPDLAAIVIGPSNPFVSVAPILAVPGLRDALAQRRVPLVAVSPIVGGQAIKGPAAKMMDELGIRPSAAWVAEQYGDLLDGLVIDETDRDLAAGIHGPRVLVAQTVMRTATDRARLAGEVLGFAAELRR
ncbi:2-phospho-L-lactate transferase [Azospirillum sp.]|uniref:2-phospho-L-lactate transferase n=1 Tax=Azospirillum sp. TaxID=34012 RepID=UPI003D7185C4